MMSWSSVTLGAGGDCGLVAHLGPGASTGQIQTRHCTARWPSDVLNPCTHTQKSRASGQGVNTFLTSSSTKRMLLLVGQSLLKLVFPCSLLCRLCNWNITQRDRERRGDRRSERGREREKEKRKGTEEKGGEAKPKPQVEKKKSL